MTQRIALIIPYFGKAPEWSDLYFETVRMNSSIDFHFFTDIHFGDSLPHNVHIHKLSFNGYVDHVNQFLDFDFRPPNAYKLCDLRPLFGYIHQDILEGYDFYGWTDMDILFGDIRKFYQDSILEKYDILSTHAHTISGHLAIIRNTHYHRTKFLKIYRWKEALLNPEFVGIDEHGIANAYLYSIWEKANYKYRLNIPKWFINAIRKYKARKMFLVEQYTTPFMNKPWIDDSVNSEQPDTWTYINGRISNCRDAEKEFIYLHFMNFKSSKWRHDGTKAPWEHLDRIVDCSTEDMKSGIVISPKGISVLSE